MFKRLLYKNVKTLGSQCCICKNILYGEVGWVILGYTYSCYLIFMCNMYDNQCI